MPKIPVVSSKELIKALYKIGYVILRQKGSHITMYNNLTNHTITVPEHEVISIGLLNSIIKSVCEKNSIDKDKFIELL